jgi:hypothetical protein
VSPRLKDMTRPFGHHAAVPSAAPVRVLNDRSQMRVLDSAYRYLFSQAEYMRNMCRRRVSLPLRHEDNVARCKSAGNRGYGGGG